MAIQDFGEKIGGAKKDQWKRRGLEATDLVYMNDAEKLKFVKKDNIWKKPDYERLVSSGISKRVVYFMKLMRDSIPTKPDFHSFDGPDEIAEKQELYVDFVKDFRDAVMQLRTEEEVKVFYDEYVSQFLENPNERYVRVVPEAKGCLTSKTLTEAATAATSFHSIDKDIKKKQFCYTEDEKILAPFEFYKYSKDSCKFSKDYRDRPMIEMKVSYGTHFFYPDEMYADPNGWAHNTYFATNNNRIFGRNYSTIEEAQNEILQASKVVKENLPKENEIQKKSRKKRFVPLQLSHIKRNGPDVRSNTDLTGEDFLNAFGFKGGEFGNWLNDDDRQASLNFAYEAFLDLANALELDPLDISLGGRLSIAFGSRGSGSALAHYEPLREVINLTKMKGAGSLAHEWGHALDDLIGKSIGHLGMMTEVPSYSALLPSSFKTLVNSLKYKEVQNEDAIKIQEEEVRQAEKQLLDYINYFFKFELTDEQKVEKEKLITALLNDPEASKKCLGYGFPGHKYPEVDAISDFRKKVYGKVIPKDYRRSIAYYMDRVCGKRKAVGTSKTVYTDFYENSMKFDSVYTQMGHGYWQSSCEMFARAFACYVFDKLKEKDIESDYLCGHSEIHCSPFVDKNGDTKMLTAFPVGEERKVINENFDRFIEDLKEKGLLRRLEGLPKASELLNYKPIKSKQAEEVLPLDEMIKLSAEKDKYISEHMIERNSGQFEFDLFR